jgi:hypothetical protein
LEINSLHQQRKQFLQPFCCGRFWTTLIYLTPKNKYLLINLNNKNLFKHLYLSCVLCPFSTPSPPKIFIFALFLLCLLHVTCYTYPHKSSYWSNNSKCVKEILRISKLCITQFSLFAFLKRRYFLLFSIELVPRRFLTTNVQRSVRNGFVIYQNNFRYISFCYTKFFVFFTTNECNVDAWCKKRLGEYKAFDKFLHIHKQMFFYVNNN